MPARTNAFHDLLPQIAPFLEVQRVHLLRFLRQGVFRYFTAIFRHEIFDPENLGVFRGGGNHACALDRRDGLLFTPDCTVDPDSMRTRLRNRSYRKISPAHMRETMMRRGQSASRRKFNRPGTLNPHAERLVRHVFERYIVGDDVTIQMLEERLTRPRLRVEKKVVLEAENICIGENASLRVQKKNVDAVPCLHLLHVIGCHGMQKTGPILSGDANPAAMGKVEQGRARREGFKSSRVGFQSHLSPLSDEDTMIHETLPVGMLGCNCQVIGDETSREAIVIDPGDDVSEITAILARHRLTAKMIVITHAHIDHIGGAQKLRQLTGASVYMHEADKVLSGQLEMQAAWLGVETPEDPGIDTAAHEGDVLRAGLIEAHVLHTPGHTPGSISIYLPLEGKLIAGDTLFEGSIGRTDLPGGDLAQIKRSILDKLYVLPEDTIVYPGHSSTTSIGHEKRHNPFVRA